MPHVRWLPGTEQDGGGMVTQGVQKLSWGVLSSREEPTAWSPGDLALETRCADSENPPLCLGDWGCGEGL